MRNRDRYRDRDRCWPGAAGKQLKPHVQTADDDNDDNDDDDDDDAIGEKGQEGKTYVAC